MTITCKWDDNNQDENMIKNFMDVNQPVILPTRKTQKFEILCSWTHLIIFIFFLIIWTILCSHYYPYKSSPIMCNVTFISNQTVNQSYITLNSDDDDDDHFVI